MGKTFDTARRWGVFFDMGGVLLDSYRAHFEAWQVILPVLGLEMTQDRFAPLSGSRGGWTSVRKIGSV